MVVDEEIANIVVQIVHVTKTPMYKFQFEITSQDESRRRACFPGNSASDVLHGRGYAPRDSNAEVSAYHVPIVLSTLLLCEEFSIVNNI